MPDKAVGSLDCKSALCTITKISTKNKISICRTDNLYVIDHLKPAHLHTHNTYSAFLLYILYLTNTKRPVVLLEKQTPVRQEIKKESISATLKEFLHISRLTIKSVPILILFLTP